MAENKKSFVLYADQRGIFDKLNDEQSGKLIKHIFAYVNDEEPEGDFVTELAFESIMRQLKRDLTKWGETREGRSKAGKASAEARRLRKEQEATNSTNVKSVQQTSTNPTVNDNVTVNVNVNDTVINKKSKAFAPPSLEEVNEYCKERKNSVNAETFVDFYSSKGWLVGKNKMKDWKASVRTWEKRENNGNNKTISGTTSGGSRATSKVADSYE
jgi:hypothetical protein